MAFRTKCSSKTTYKCRSICDHPTTIGVTGVMMVRMRASTLVIIATRLQADLAPVDNFEKWSFSS